MWGWVLAIPSLATGFPRTGIVQESRSQAVPDYIARLYLKMNKQKQASKRANKTKVYEVGEENKEVGSSEP